MVMLGSLLPGTARIFPARRDFPEGASVQGVPGAWGSLAAMNKGSKDRYFQEWFQNQRKLLSRGRGGAVCPNKGGVQTILPSLQWRPCGRANHSGYTGFHNIESCTPRPSLCRLPPPGAEVVPNPHDIYITKEAQLYHQPQLKLTSAAVPIDRQRPAFFVKKEGYLCSSCCWAAAGDGEDHRVAKPAL